jgi:thiamine-phosphate diphosphorylase
MGDPVMAAPSGAVDRVPSLHVVTDDQVLARPDFPELASRMLRRGRGRIALHLRGPWTSGAQLHRLALTLVGYGESVVVNDRVDVALVTGLRRVHLGARSVPPRIARAILGEGARLGVSTHSVSAVRDAAQEGADWIFVGTIYPTPSHPGDPGRGVGAVKEATRVAPDVPVLAIGGVGPEHVREARLAGGHGVAVIRGIWGALDPLAALNEYLEMLDSER